MNGMLADDSLPEVIITEHVAAMWKRGVRNYWNPAFATVRDLMLAGCCFLAMCSAVFGDKSDGAENTATAEPDKYLVVFTLPGCGPCNRWKSCEQPRLEASGHHARFVDAAREPQWRVGTVPEFWICDRSTQTRLKRITGYTSADVLLRELR